MDILLVEHVFCARLLQSMTMEQTSILNASILPLFLSQGQKPLMVSFALTSGGNVSKPFTSQSLFGIQDIRRQSQLP